MHAAERRRQLQMSLGFSVLKMKFKEDTNL